MTESLKSRNLSYFGDVLSSVIKIVSLSSPTEVKDKSNPLLSPEKTKDTV